MNGLAYIADEMTNAVTHPQLLPFAFNNPFRRE
jgi:hypothetical protein